MGSLTEYLLSDLTSGSLGGGHSYIESTLNSQAREPSMVFYFTSRIMLCSDNIVSDREKGLSNS
jgi:hypothetical protein